jgi:tartrate-resistant acid phosphatase type 5
MGSLNDYKGSSAAAAGANAPATLRRTRETFPSTAMRWPFEQWGADVVLAGHDHVYERFEVGQIPYFTVELGGGSPNPFVTTIPESRAQFNSDFGAMRLTANHRGMLFEFIDANGTLVESFNSRKCCR